MVGHVGDDVDDVKQARASERYRQLVDPVAVEVLVATDPWDAYRTANKVPNQLAVDLEWLPHGGSVYVAWAELTDSYETGKTPIADAHAVLRQAASAWLDRPGLPDGQHVERWVREATATLHSLFLCDGDFWRSPPAVTTTGNRKLGSSLIALGQQPIPWT